MVHPTTKPAAATDSHSDDDWDVVDPNTAAVMRADRPPNAAPQREGMGAAEPSADRMSFVMVGATAAVMRAPDAAAEAVEEASAAADPAPASVPQEGAKSLSSSSSKRAAKQDSPPQPPAATVEEALQRMSESPALPGVSPTATTAAAPPMPAAVLTPPQQPDAAGDAPPPLRVGRNSGGSGTDARCLRNIGTLGTEEATQRTVVGRDAEREFRRIVNDWRLERQRLGDRAARPSAAADEAIARRIAEEERRAAEEQLARRREEEERRSAEALLAERRAAELARARAGPNRCDCLGASAGHHRPNCPRSQAQ